MRFACWIRKATHTHTHTYAEYVIFVATMVIPCDLYANCLSCFLPIPALQSLLFLRALFLGPLIFPGISDYICNSINLTLEMLQTVNIFGFKLTLLQNGVWVAA